MSTKLPEAAPLFNEIKSRIDSARQRASVEITPARVSRTETIADELIISALRRH